MIRDGHLIYRRAIGSAASVKQIGSRDFECSSRSFAQSLVCRLNFLFVIFVIRRLGHCRSVRAGARQTLEVILPHRLCRSWGGPYVAELRAHAKASGSLAEERTHRRHSQGSDLRGARGGQTGSSERSGPDRTRSLLRAEV